MEENLPIVDPQWAERHAAALIANYAQWTGRALLETLHEDPSRWFEALFHADFALVSHGTEDVPLFNFGNLKALELFELDWEAFTKLPSKESAEPVHRSEREELLHRVSEYGFIDDYQGIRITSTGRRFQIHKATVWNLLDAKGALYGQAACFNDWTWL